MWTCGTIDDLCNIEYGTRVVKKNEKGTEYPVYGGGGESFRINRFNRCDRLVISRFGMSLKCTRYVSGKFFLNDSGLTLSPKDKNLSQPYLDKLILNLNNKIFHLGSGSAQKNLRMDKFRLLNISYPSLLEQEHIVRRLNTAFAEIDVAIISIKNSLGMSSQLFQNTLKETFKDLIASAPKKTLRDVSKEFGRGKSKHRPRNDIRLFGKEIPFIQTGNISSAEFYIKDFEKQYSNFGIKQSKVWEKGTVCITIAANIAELAILDFDACFPDSIIGIYPDNTITNSEYIFYLLSFFQGYIKSKSKGSAQQNINLRTFETEKFPFPSDLNLQNKVINKLNQVRLELIKYQSLMEEKLEQLKDLKSAILLSEFKNKVS